MKNKKVKIREFLVLVFLAAVYGTAVMVTGQACAVSFCQPKMPAKLYIK